MYITLFAIVLIIGLLMLLLPGNLFRKLSKIKSFIIFLRLSGIVLIAVSAVSIYAVLSGAVELPLFK